MQIKKCSGFTGVPAVEPRSHLQLIVEASGGEIVRTDIGNLTVSARKPEHLGVLNPPLAGSTD